jgi:hypothetical protein
MSLCNMKLWLFASQQLKTVAITVYGPAFGAAAAPTTNTMSEISTAIKALTCSLLVVQSSQIQAEHTTCGHKRKLPVSPSTLL